MRTGLATVAANGLNWMMHNMRSKQRRQMVITQHADEFCSVLPRRDRREVVREYVGRLSLGVRVVHVIETFLAEIMQPRDVHTMQSLNVAKLWLFAGLDYTRSGLVSA